MTHSDVRGSFASRQPASARYRRWEIAGTAHARLRDHSEPALRSVFRPRHPRWTTQARRRRAALWQAQ